METEPFPLPERTTEMLDRIKNLFNATVNKGVSKMETPEVLAEQAQMELEKHLKEVTEAYTSSITSEKMLQSQMKKAADELTSWESRATMAVQQGNDDLAKEALRRKQEAGAKQQALEQQLAGQQKASADLKAKHAEVEAAYSDFKRKRSSLESRAKAGDALEKAQNLTTGYSGNSMDKWEEKIREKEARSDAMRELSGHTPADDQLKMLEKNSAVDDELAALKASLGEGPKLIVDVTNEKKDEKQ